MEQRDIFIKNIDNVKLATNKNPITVMNWSEMPEKEVVIGYANQLIKIYNVKSGGYSYQEVKGYGSGRIVGVAKFSDAMMTAVESGKIRIWRAGVEPTTIETGKHLHKVQHSSTNENLVASGGNENDLALWDVTTGQQTFKAKNVRHDELDLRVPIWVTDITFLNIGTTGRIAVTTRYGHVRLYDPLARHKKPVVSVTVPESALYCISPCSRDYHVIVGSGTGRMNLVDLRSKGLVMNKYKDFLGGIKSIACTNEEPYIASACLDRFFRIHHLTTKQVLVKEYMQSKLTAVLLNPDFDLKQQHAISSDEDELDDVVETKMPFEEEQVTSPPDLVEKLKEETPPPAPRTVSVSTASIAEKRMIRASGTERKKKHKPS